jgi:hypothetical protein
MLFYILIIIIIILLLIPNQKNEHAREDFTVFDVKRDILSKTGELAKYLILK